MTAGGRAKGEGMEQALLPVLLFVAFADTFFQMPILSPLATSLGAGPALAGMVVGGYSLTNMLGNVAAGPILDRYGYVRPLAAAFAATAAVLLAYPLVSRPGELVAVRLLHGVAAATLVPAIFAWRAARTAPGAEMASMGRLGALIGVAAMTCPPVSGVLVARAGFAAAYLLLASLFAAAAAALVLGGHREEPAAGPSRGQAAPAGLLSPLGRVWREAPARGVLLVWLGAMAMVTAVGTLALRLPLDLAAGGAAAPTRAAGLLLGLYSTAAVLAMLGLPRLFRPAGPPGLLTMAGAGLAGMAAGAALLAWSPALPWQTLGVTVLGFGFGVAFPALNASVGRRVEPGERGSAYALFYAFYSLGAVLGPLAAGAVVQWAPAAGWGYAPAVAAAGVAAAAVIRRAGRESRTPP